ncbi:MAG: phospholipid carrier-dependent glycosyltransferase [Pseudomonadota bacterium]
MTEAAHTGVPQRLWYVWLLLGALWLSTLPVRALLDPDEGRYAEIPREMVASGDWVTPRLNDLKYFEKPPLQYWATAAAYSVFGVHEWTARLWAAVLAFLTLPLVYGFARRVGQSRSVALTAVSILAVNPYFGLVGQLNLLDQAFAFLLVASVFALLLGQAELTNRARQRRWLLVAWVGMALAVLSKGIVALVLGAAALGLYMLVQRDFSPLKRMHFVPGLAVFLAIAAPWFWLVQARNPEFAEFFFMHEHFARFLTTVHARTQPLWFFPAIVLVALLPVIWSVVPWTRGLRQTPQPPPAFDTLRFLALWCLVVVVFFSVSQSKLAPYIFPMMAPLAVLLAPVVQADTRSVSRAGYVTLALTVAICTTLSILCWRKDGALATLVLWSAVATIAVLAAVVVNRSIQMMQRPVAQWLLLAVAATVAYQGMLISYAEVPPAKSAKRLVAQSVVKPIGSQTRLFSVGQFRPSIAYYLRAPLSVYAFEGELAFGLQQQGYPNGQDAQDFLQRWLDSTDAVAFLEPQLYSRLSAKGMPGTIIAADAHTVAVRRQ